MERSLAMDDAGHTDGFTFVHKTVSQNQNRKVFIYLKYCFTKYRYMIKMKFLHELTIQR